MRDMELVKSKENDFLDLVISSVRPSNSFLRLTERNRKSLKEIINYLTDLHNKNVIDEKQFSELVTLACSNFIENEVEFRISKSINKRINYFFEKL